MGVERGSLNRVEINRSDALILERELRGWFHLAMSAWMFRDGEYGSTCEPLVAYTKRADHI
jgi:hypothetical protein